jgi:poly-gamma-glutamate synthase PgsB/CapB
MSPSLEPLLIADLSDVERRLFRSLLEDLRREFRDWLNKRPALGLESPDILASQWVDFLKYRIGEEMQAVANLHRQLADFHRSLAAATEETDRRQVILSFARELGATPRQLKKDEAAFQRWFGPDAVRDRYRRRHAAHERLAAFLLNRLGAAAAQRIQPVKNSQEQTALWHWLDLETLLQPLLAYEGDTRLNLAAFRCLAQVLATLSPEVQELAIDDSTLQYVYRSALHSQQDVWIQCAAIELLSTLSLTSFEQALQHRLLRPLPGNDLFVRRRALLLFAQHFDRLQNPFDLIPTAIGDPSPFVRQALAKGAAKCPAVFAATWLRYLALEDPAPEVRAATLIELLPLLSRADLRDDLLGLLVDLLQNDTHEFVLRVACHVAEKGTEILAASQEPYLEHWQKTVSKALNDLHVRAASLKVRRWAAQASEFIWCESDPQTRALKTQLAAFARTIPRAKSRWLPRELTTAWDPALIARVWAVISRNDFDCQLDTTGRGLRVTRGHVFGFRWWRWLYEFRHPSPDKRQAFKHTVGRVFHANIHVPSGILGELAQTNVPGEPLHIAEEASWRPYLPLVDQMISSLERFGRQSAVRIFTSEGLTTLHPPRGWLRVRAGLKLTWKFKEYAEKRNWRESQQEKPAAYLQSLQDLGFQITFEPYLDREGHPVPADPAVTRFFPTVFVPGPIVELWDRMAEYFVSLYQNSVGELGLFIVCFGLLFLGLHLFYNQRQRRWRKRIPLVIGGWGTRGKSGTERLKAALFNAAGFGLVSKTTGCEAMFLQADPFGDMKEMFLYRPYDKATIWEQVNVVRIAGNLKAEVMLWECMGLTPSYVKILQRRWMRDDFSTITNTYPDHEDLQGPAGINIPEVIACFIPEKSLLVTSEEQMLPILEQEAQHRGTQLHPIGWLEAGMIASDVLKRFPYEEHPYNIALVLGLADQLGIDRDFALKELADRVLPDLGVLKTYPTATRRTRCLEFTNGMSANERFGTLSNWTRTGFDRQDYIQEPGVQLTTVVNNRADRVPRSQVFARVLVNDISADRHVLIGGNLNGLMGYIRGAWAERAPSLSLWKDKQNPKPADGLAILDHYAIQMRLPIRAEWIQINLRIMLQAQPQITQPEALVALWCQSDELKKRLEFYALGEIETAILNRVNYDLALLQEYNQFADKVRAAKPEQAEKLNHEFRWLLGQWFQSKLIVVEDYFATGDQLIEIITQHTPPGFLNRIMGIQNIKGTGLDFVYRWQAWQTCYSAAQPLRADKVVLTPQLTRALAEFQEYGVLCEEYVRDTVSRIKTSNVPQRKDMLDELDRILAHLDTAMAMIQQKMKGGSSQGSYFTKLIMVIEEFLDAGDAVRRRKLADQVYQDLIDERISRQRAVIELQALTQRQKGGWLLKKLQARAQKA